MLSKSQANLIANELLHQAHQAKSSEKTPAARPLDLLYLGRALMGLPRPVQALVVARATSKVSKSPIFILGSVALIGSMGVFWYRVDPAATENLTIVFVATCWAVVMLLRTMLVRHRVKQLATQLRSLLKSPLR